MRASILDHDDEDLFVVEDADAATAARLRAQSHPEVDGRFEKRFRREDLLPHDVDVAFEPEAWVGGGRRRPLTPGVSRRRAPAAPRRSAGSTARPRRGRPSRSRCRSSARPPVASPR